MKADATVAKESPGETDWWRGGNFATILSAALSAVTIALIILAGWKLNCWQRCCGRDTRNRRRRGERPSAAPSAAMEARLQSRDHAPGYVAEERAVREERRGSRGVGGQPRPLAFHGLAPHGALHGVPETGGVDGLNDLPPPAPRSPVLPPSDADTTVLCGDSELTSPDNPPVR